MVRWLRDSFCQESALSRSERLLELLQSLRRRTRAVSAAALAKELGIHTRSVYRDIETLRGQGAPIEGEAGVGYILRPGFTLPPLLFTREEIESLVLGARWVAAKGDQGLGAAARNSLAKIEAVLTPSLRAELASTTLFVGPQRGPTVDDALASAARVAIRHDKKLVLEYEDQGGGRSKRVVWPFCIGFFDQVRVLVAWCEMRQDFRHFRLDRVRTWSPLEESYPETHHSLLVRWQQKEGLAPDTFDLY